MIDKEKVIAALYHCAVLSNGCGDCPYDEICAERPNINMALMDAVKLLRKEKDDDNNRPDS